MKHILSLVRAAKEAALKDSFKLVDGKLDVPMPLPATKPSKATLADVKKWANFMHYSVHGRNEYTTKDRSYPLSPQSIIDIVSARRRDGLFWMHLEFWTPLSNLSTDSCKR